MPIDTRTGLLQNCQCYS